MSRGKIDKNIGDSEKSVDKDFRQLLYTMFFFILKHYLAFTLSSLDARSLM